MNQNVPQKIKPVDTSLTGISFALEDDSDRKLSVTRPKNRGSTITMGIFRHIAKRFLTQPVETPYTLTSKKTQPKRLISQVHQYAPLIRLQDERQFLEVFIHGADGHSESFQSMIIGVDLYSHRLIIDALSPRLQNPSALTGKTLTIRHHNQQQVLNLVSTVNAWDEGEQTLILDLPEELGYQARRQDERILIEQKPPINAIITPQHAAPWYGSIVNLSVGGARIIIMGDLRHHLQKNQILKQCCIDLSTFNKIQCSAIVKAFSYRTRPFKRTELSIQFASPQSLEGILPEPISSDDTEIQNTTLVDVNSETSTDKDRAATPVEGKSAA